MLIIDALFWLFLFRQLDKNAEEFIEETDWEQVQLQVSAETMGSFRRKRFTPYLGWWALYLFDVCHGWSVAYLKCFFFFLLFFRLYSVVWRIVQYVSCRLHPRDSTKRRTNLAPLFCCRVHMCSMPRAWMHLKNSHSTENQCVPCADHIITRNVCSGWKFFLFLYNSDNTIFSTDHDCREVNPFVRTARSCCLPSGQGTLLVISFSLIWWMDEEIFPLSSGFELLILQVLQVAGWTILHLLVKILS